MKQVILLLALLPAAACTAARAHVAPEEHPALVVPPVPPRVIEPLPVDPPPLDPVNDLPSAPPNPPRPRPQNREPTRAADPKTETKPPETPPADPTAPVAPLPVPPLRTSGTPDGPEATQQIRDTIERAWKLLGKVDYQALKADSRQNYDNAKSFIKQAEDALKANNLEGAKSLANRAETIAKLLFGG
jgi:hypothetical protein